MPRSLGVVGGGIGAGIVHRKAIEDLFEKAFKEIEGVVADVVDDRSNAPAPVSVELKEDGGTMGVLASAHGDHLRGNSDSNWLAGQGGNDTLAGGGGDDVLDGGSGADVIEGGEGDDTADYSGSNAGVHVDLAAGTASGGHAQGDRLSSIEHLTGGSLDDALRGTDGSNMLYGGAGSDVLEGRGGDDYLIGGAGADVLEGGEGEDLADYTSSAAGVTVDLASGNGAGGDAEGDRLSSIDHLLGSSFDDELLGQDGWNNILAGLDGHDVLDGRGGDDTLIGGAGNDVLTGGAGNDVFVLKGAIGHDIITDFESGDVIELSAADEDFVDGYSVLQAAEQVGNDVLIRLDAERSITLANTQLDTLRHDDFIVAG